MKITQEREFGKAAGYKINKQTKIAFIYTNNNWLECVKEEKTPFKTATEKNTNLTRNVQNFYEKNL